MDAPVIMLRGPNDHPGAVEQIVAALLDGGLVVLPTDTVYGLVALPGEAGAVDRIFELKGRSIATPVAVLCSGLEQAVSLADPMISEALTAVGERWWPGPLTIVTPRRAGLELHLGAPATTVGVRVPDDALVRAVAERVGPIAATSANRHREPTPIDARGAARSLGPGLALVVDGGERSIAASTVIDATVEPWQVLRSGPVDHLAVIDAASAASDPDR